MKYYTEIIKDPSGPSHLGQTIQMAECPGRDNWISGKTYQQSRDTAHAIMRAGL